QAARGAFHVADGERNGGRRRVFVRGLVREAGDGGRVIHRVDGQKKRPAGGRCVGIGNRDGNRGRAGLIGRRRKGERAIRSAAAKDDIPLRHQPFPYSTLFRSQAARGAFHVADGEWNGGRRRVFVRGLVRDTGDGGRVIHRIDRQQKTRARCAPATVPHCQGDRGRAEMIGGRPKGDSAIRSAAAKKDIRIGHQVRVR